MRLDVGRKGKGKCIQITQAARVIVVEVDVGQFAVISTLCQTNRIPDRHAEESHNEVAESIICTLAPQTINTAAKCHLEFAAKMFMRILVGKVKLSRASAMPLHQSTKWA